MMSGYQFEWDDEKDARNSSKHDVSSDLASTVFQDPNILTLADINHSETEERWFSIGWAANGLLLSVVYLWFDEVSQVRIRLISARKATRNEIRYYQDGSDE
jgi:uncharacterized DUF497 family protein